MRNERERSRAEIVRMRRREQAQKRITKSSAMATRPLPPITSRSGITYGGPARSSPANTTRKFQAALTMPGIEVRMPAIQITSAGIRSRLISLLLSILLGTCLYLAATMPELRAAPAQVSGNQRIGADEINAVLNTTGQPIFTLTSAELQMRLRLNYPELKSAQVSISLPNTIRVSIVERQPVLLWQQGSGYTWIDEDGVAFRPHGSPANLIPVATFAAPPAGATVQNDPLSPVPYIAPELVKAIQTLAPNAPSGSTLEYDPKYGLGWSDSRGWKVFFGTDEKDMALKMQVYKSLVDSLVQKGIQPTFISVQYANAPYYRINQ